MNRLRIFSGRGGVELMSTASTSSVVVLDDDDDVQVCSPRSFAQAAKGKRNDESHSEEDLLQLRLGLSGSKLPRKPRKQQSRARQQQQQQQQQQRHRSKRVHPATIDLTVPDDCEVIYEMPQKKKVAAAPAPPPPPPAKEMSLTCGICFDTMKNETSTVCGHLFCGSCILSAIQAQKRCPTCRRKLTSSMVHRIYISGNSAG